MAFRVRGFWILVELDFRMVASYTKDRAVLRGTTPLEGGRYKVVSVMWEPSQATLDIGFCVLCGGKGAAPGCAHLVGA